MRTFERTQPWISFRIELQKAAPPLWLLLGEAASKCEHIAGVPLRPSVAQSLHQLYLAKGVLATTAIEGNTLTEEEVLARLQGKLRLPPSKEYLAQEVDNIVTACNRMGERLRAGDTALTFGGICEFNRQVLEKLTLDEGIVAGRVRTLAVLVGNVYRGAPAEDCEFLLRRLCEWLAGEDFAAPKGMETVYAINPGGGGASLSGVPAVAPHEQHRMIRAFLTGGDFADDHADGADDIANPEGRPMPVTLTPLPLAMVQDLKVNFAVWTDAQERT